MNLAKPIDGPEALKTNKHSLDKTKPLITKCGGKWYVYSTKACDYDKLIAAHRWMHAQNRKIEINKLLDAIDAI
jgi:hypothetical protein